MGADPTQAQWRGSRAQNLLRIGQPVPQRDQKPEAPDLTSDKSCILKESRINRICCISRGITKGQHYYHLMNGMYGTHSHF